MWDAYKTTNAAGYDIRHAIYPYSDWIRRKLPRSSRRKSCGRTCQPERDAIRPSKLDVSARCACVAIHSAHKYHALHLFTAWVVSLFHNLCVNHLSAPPCLCIDVSSVPPLSVCCPVARQVSDRSLQLPGRLCCTRTPDIDPSGESLPRIGSFMTQCPQRGRPASRPGQTGSTTHAVSRRAVYRDDARVSAVPPGHFYSVNAPHCRGYKQENGAVCIILIRFTGNYSTDRRRHCSLRYTREKVASGISWQ